MQRRVGMMAGMVAAILAACLLFRSPDEPVTTGLRRPPAGVTVSGGERGGAAGAGGPPAFEDTRHQRPRSILETIQERSSPDWRPDQLLVRWLPEVTAAERDAVLRRCQGRSLRHLARLRFDQVVLPSGSDLEAAARCLAVSPLVEGVERNYLRYPQGTSLPDDPGVARQWGMVRLGIDRLWPLVDGNADIVIAVIDTGIPPHPDLAANLWTNAIEVAGVPGVDDDGNGYVDDIAGWDFGEGDNDPAGLEDHAAGVAGIIAAQGNNGLGIAGVLWRARIANLKVADATGIMDVSAIAAALDYALGIPGLRIVNCSFGGGSPSDVERRAFEALADAGILAICAAGNGGGDIDQQGFYPAGYDLPNMITVAAADRNDGLAPFSNYGLRMVHCMAPGDTVVSLGQAGTSARVLAGGATYPAIGMLYAGTTDSNGARGLLVDGGLGYPDDFSADVRGNIALVLRGELTFRDKAANAEAAGAIALVVANNVDETTDPDDTLDTVGGTLGGPGIPIPVVSVSKADGETLATMLGMEVTVVNEPTADGLITESGTSFAAPFVTGIAGMMLAVRPQLTALEVKEHILASVQPLPAVADRLAAGGMVDAWGALQRIWPRGDIDGNRRVDLADVLLGFTVLGGGALQRPFIGDVDGDGMVGLADLLYGLGRLAGER